VSITLALLAYGEAENLKILLPKVREKLSEIDEEFEILVVDGETSVDDTENVCNQMGARYVHQRYPKFGGAFRTAIEEASMDKFLIMDADGSHDPRYIPDIYKKFMDDNCDVVIGSRYTKGGVSNDSTSSKMMSHMLNFAYGLVIGVKAKDLSTDYRMYHTKQLKELELTCVNYDILEETLLKLKLNKKDLKVEEVPIKFEKRMYGESKRKLLPFIKSYIKTLFKLASLRWRS